MSIVRLKSWSITNPIFITWVLKQKNLPNDVIKKILDIIFDIYEFSYKLEHVIRPKLFFPELKKAIINIDQAIEDINDTILEEKDTSGVYCRIKRSDIGEIKWDIIEC